MLDKMKRLGQLSVGFKVLLGIIVVGGVYLTAIERMESPEFLTIVIAIIGIARLLAGADPATNATEQPEGRK